MKLLEDILKEKCEKEDTEILLAQWKYDKELYKDILQNTKDYYCHYTDHGINHSEAVLSNIVRILGIDKIKELSSLDIWLLLEASYIHDSGMFITRNEVEELCNSKEFCDYFECLKLDISNDLYEYTSYFEISNNKLIMLENEYNLKAEYGLKFIIGEYNRSRHSKRAKDIINKFDRFKKENTLIPKRIVDIAFLIAESHGKKFDDVMKIDKIETGLKLEKGHPRFIACLLRLGDLLDIDNNRFSKIILKNIEEIMPQKSKNHLEKHKSIVHYRVDNDLIEITAKIENCGDQTYDVVSEVSDWFEYLKKEHNLQVLNWGKIKPINFSGLLPSLGEIKIDVKDYDFIDSMNKPKFTVDTNNVLTILKGSGIYQNELKALREIIQNSIDAIFLKVYNENENQIVQDIKLKKDYNELRKKYLKNEEIQVIIRFQSEELVEITIKDTGIGISKDELKFLINAGSSPSNYEKKVLIKKMPFWLRPSGNFGIGFQSIFMLTDKVNLKSKKNHLETGIEVDLFSPSYKGNKKGKIFIKKLQIDNLKFKTQLKFLYKYERINSPVVEFWKDKVIEKKIPEYIRMEIKKIASYSPINIKLKIIGTDNDREINYFNESVYENTYIKEFGLELFDTKKIKLRNRFGIDFFYKNQRLKSGMRIKFLNIGINFLEDEANDLLKINRDRIKEEILESKEFEKRIMYSIFMWIKLKENDIQNNEELKMNVSMFLNYYNNFYQDYLNLNYASKIDIKLIDFFKANSNFKELEKDELEIVIKGSYEIKEVFLNKKEFFVDKLSSDNFDEQEKNKQLKSELYFYLTYLLNRYNYKVFFNDEYIYLKKVKENEEEIRRDEKKPIYLNGIYLDYTTLEIKELRINVDLLKKDFEKIRFTRRINDRTEDLFSILKDIKKRNTCFFPLKYISNNQWLFNNEIEKRYIEMCFKYNINKNITKEIIKEKLKYYVNQLSTRFEVYNSVPEVEEEKIKENGKIEELLKIFPEIKLENGDIDFDKLKQLIENKN